MSTDFWAGYISGAVGIIIGNPLDIVKVRLQARVITAPDNLTFPLSNYRGFQQGSSAFATGTAAPILGYGGLNALLFVSYNRAEARLNQALSIEGSLWTTWVAGAIGGLATWIVSTPTELIKCRAQVSSQGLSSWTITRDIWQAEGIRGLYFGGIVTALRDSIGYGFYFWSYEILTGLWPVPKSAEAMSFSHDVPKALLCGGLAGVATWASVFPLDVIKTRVQTQPDDLIHSSQTGLIAHSAGRQRRLTALDVTRQVYREHGARAFMRGFGVCAARAFIVNAVQWTVYEWIMRELGGKQKQGADSDLSIGI